jgi:hypothetical protein
MSATVRVFTHAGITSAKVDAGGGRFTTDSVFLLKQPYLGKETLTATTGTAVSSSRLTAPKGSSVLSVEVQPGKTIHYEINPSNRSVAATTDSPTLRERTNFEFGPDWSISVLEAV